MLTVVARSAGAGREKPGEYVRGAASRLPWAWDGLCMGVPMAETSGEGYRDIVTNQTGTPLRGPTWVRDSRGNTAVAMNPTTDAYVEYAYHPRHNQPSTELTAYVRFQRTTLGGTPIAFGGYLTNVYASTDPWQSWAMVGDAASSGKIAGSITVNGVNSGTPDSSSALPTSSYMSAFLRWRTGTPLRVDVYDERGTLVTSGASATNLTGTITYNSTVQPVRINGNESAGIGGQAANYSQAMAWSRRLNDTEVTSLVADPFGWYSPRRETIIAAAPFPVGPGMAAQPMTIAGFGGRR